MKTKRFLPLAAAITALALGGCSMRIGDRMLLKPPKTTGREAAIIQLIEKAAGEECLLKYPNSGEYRSAIISEDLNADGTDEAIAFYRKSSEQNLRMLVMSGKDGKWNTCGNFKTDFTDVDCVAFADVDLDGSLEIVTGYTSQNTTNTLNIYDYDPKKRKAEKFDFSTNYSAFATGDFDKDGASEVIAFTLSSTESTAQATMVDFKDGKMSAASQCAMDPSVIKYDNVLSGKISQTQPAVVLDGVLESGYNTQAVFYNTAKRRLMNFPLSKRKNSTPLTRSFNVKSQDIDDDKILEIPVTDPEQNSSDETVTAPVISWCKLDSDKLTLLREFDCVGNFEYGFYFKLPESFEGEIVSAVSEDNRELSIFVLDGKKRGDLVLTFKVFDVGASSDATKGYTTIESYNQYIYAYRIVDNDYLYIDDSTVRDNFALYEVSA